MGDLHVLPLDGIRCGGFERLTRELSSAFEAGDYLGPRVSHIWASARALEGLSDLLEARIDELAAVQNAAALEVPAAIVPLRQLLQSIRTLSRMASDFPSTARIDPVDASGP